MRVALRIAAAASGGESVTFRLAPDHGHTRPVNDFLDEAVAWTLAGAK